MKIVILGASGKTGTQLVTQALAAGHEVGAFVRNSESITTVSPQLIVIPGDAKNQSDLEKALEGQEAVVSALGSNKVGDKLILQSTQALIAAAHAIGIKRIIMLSSFLVSPDYKPNMFGKLIRKVLYGMLTDKISGEELLKQSDLDWTVVYATALDRAPAGGTVRIVSAGEHLGIGNGIARADVAAFMLQQLADKNTFKKTLTITTK